MARRPIPEDEDLPISKQKVATNGKRLVCDMQMELIIKRMMREQVMKSLLVSQ